MNGIIFNIQKFCISDGPGIRTTVFLKGCPLRCAWCHNPESQYIQKEIMFHKEKCTSCGRCKGITVKDDFICYSSAREICGREISAEDVINEILKDKIFYENSEGGMTLSGGEPLFQYDFSLELLKRAKENGIHTALETCGYTTENLDEISRYVDLWLYDVKISNDELHKQYTGVSNKQILKNLYYLDSKGAQIILRCPIIPEININDEHFENLAQFANKLKNVQAIHLEPYHPLGISKAEQLGRKQSYENQSFLEKDRLVKFVEKLKLNVTTAVEVL